MYRYDSESSSRMSFSNIIIIGKNINRRELFYFSEFLYSIFLRIYRKNTQQRIHCHFSKLLLIVIFKKQLFQVMIKTSYLNYFPPWEWKYDSSTLKDVKMLPLHTLI